GQQVVPAGLEEIFGIVPGGGDERNAAGEGFESLSGGSLGLGPARHADGEGEAGEGSRHLAVGNPAGGVDTRLQQGSPPGLGSRRAVDPGEEAQLADGTGEVLAQLQAVVVPPVANPYQVASPVLDAARIEDAGVGGSVPRPG